MENLVQDLITDTVVGAVIGSCITLVGVWLTNHYQSMSRKEDREHALKSEIYMTAAEQLVTRKSMLMKLPNISQEEMERSSAQVVTTAKLTVVATNETVQAVTELSAAIDQKLLALLPEKLPLDNLRTDIRILSNRLDKSFQKQNQMLNEMTAYNLRGDSDPRLWQALQNNSDRYSKQIDQFIQEQDSKYTELNRAMKELNMPFENEKLRILFSTLHTMLISAFDSMNHRLPTAEESAHFCIKRI